MPVQSYARFCLVGAVCTLGLAGGLVGVKPTARAAEAMPANGADMQMMQAMRTMQNAMAAAPMTGNADHDFAAIDGVLLRPFTIVRERGR